METVETLVVRGEIVAVEGEIDSFTGETVETDSLMGEIDSFIGEIEVLVGETVETDSFIGEIDSFTGETVETDSLIGEIDSFIGETVETDSLMGEMVSRKDSRVPMDIPSMVLSSFISAVFRRGPLTGDSSSIELSESEPVDTTDMRDDRRTRGGDGSESNWAK